MTPAARLSAAIEVLADLERSPPAGGGCPEGLGPVASLRRLEGPRRHREPRLRRPAPQSLGGLDHGRGDAARGAPRHAEAPARPGRRDHRRLFSGERHAPAPLTDAERERLDGRRRSTARRPRSPAISRTGSSLRSGTLFGDDLVPELQALATRAPLDLRVNTLKVASREGGARRAVPSRRRRDAALAARAAHRSERGRPRPGRAGRARVPEGLDRDPGRGLAARGAALRREAGRAGGRPLRRRRRQDPGARRHDGEPRPDLRHRQRCPPPRADPRAARPRRRPQRPGPHAAGQAPMR